jgi:clan AA aspartic protease (TIGR02281 family)
MVSSKVWLIAVALAITVFLVDHDALDFKVRSSIDRISPADAQTAPLAPAPLAPAPLAPAASSVQRSVPSQQLAAPYAPPPAVPPSHTLKLPVLITPDMRSDRDEAVGKRERDGRFSFDAAVNGAHVRMVFDTGASLVCLRAEDAERLGIDIGGLSFSGYVRTANGLAEVAPATIATLTVGNITRRNVSALVVKQGKLEVNLLGQSFLTRIAGFNLDGASLILRGGG